MWTTPDSIIRLPSLLLLLSSSICKTISSFSKSKIASSCHNSSTLTPVLPLKTSFNTIFHFSDHLAYLPNAPQYSRWIHQRNCLSSKSLSSPIQPGWIALPVSGPSIILVNNDSNWKDAPKNPITNTIIANRPTSSTYSQLKSCQSNNTNEQLANVLGWLADTLNAN